MTSGSLKCTKCGASISSGTSVDGALLCANCLPKHNCCCTKRLDKLEKEMKELKDFVMSPVIPKTYHVGS